MDSRGPRAWATFAAFAGTTAGSMIGSGAARISSKIAGVQGGSLTTKLAL